MSSIAGDRDGAAVTYCKHDSDKACYGHSSTHVRSTQLHTRGDSALVQSPAESVESVLHTWGSGRLHAFGQAHADGGSLWWSTWCRTLPICLRDHLVACLMYAAETRCRLLGVGFAY